MIFIYLIIAVNMDFITQYTNNSAQNVLINVKYVTVIIIVSNAKKATITIKY